MTFDRLEEGAICLRFDAPELVLDSDVQASGHAGPGLPAPPVPPVQMEVSTLSDGSEGIVVQLPLPVRKDAPP